MKDSFCEYKGGALSQIRDMQGQTQENVVANGGKISLFAFLRTGNV